MNTLNPASATPTRHPVTVLRDVPYTSAVVGWSSASPRQRSLTMDLYLPDRGPSAPRPAIVMAFGGAFHRGSKEDDSFEAEGKNTAVAEYCQRFAERGHVAASIDYRLVPEDPAPGNTPVVHSPEKIPTSRVAHVRQLMGLPPATPAMLWAGIEAASDDMGSAIAFIHANARRWNIDPERVVAGGFSAGARTALNAAFGEKARVAAVLALSGYMDVEDLRAHALSGDRAPPMLLIHGSHDLDYIVQNTPSLCECMSELGIRHELWSVENAGHFYPRTALAQRSNSLQKASVEEVIHAFLDSVL